MRLRTLLLVTSMACVYANAFPQFKKLRTLNLTEDVVSCAVDRPGDLYLSTSQDQLMKYDPDGTLKVVVKNTLSPTLLDPHDGARMFAYYRSERKYESLNPSFEPTAAFTIDSAFIIEPWLACLSGEHNVWVIDAADQSLKKINTKLAQVEVDVKLDPATRISDIIFMREYQGFIFMLVKNTGIVVFNGMGKLIKSIVNSKVISFNFLGEELYYLHQDTLYFLDLFSTNTRTLKLPEAAAFAILTDQRLYMINGKTVDIFKSDL